MTQNNKSAIRVGIDDFITNETKIPDAKIPKDAKLMDFSNIKVGMIDPRISNEVLDLANKIKESLNKIS